MKKAAFVTTIMVIILSCSQPSGYTINGKMDGNIDKQVILVTDNEFPNPPTYLDTAEIKDGTFIFQGAEVSDVVQYRLQFSEDKSILLFLENGTIEIRGNIDSAEYTVKGTPNNDAWTAYNEQLKPINDKQKVLSEQYNAAFEKNDTAAQRATMNAYMEQQKQVEQITNNFIKAHPTLPAAAFLAYEKSYGGQASQIDSLVALFDPALQKTFYITKMKDRAEKLRLVEVGKTAPDFTLPSPDGTPVSLSSFRGKYLLIDFWASWCGPCRAEMPHVVKLYEKYKGKDFEILSVSLDSKREDWTTAITKLKMSWPQVSDVKGWASDPAQLYCVIGIPHMILLDKDGVIIAKNLFSEDLAIKLKEIFKK